VPHQVLFINQAQNWEKKQVEEAQKIQKLNETEGIVIADGEYKHEDHSKSFKANKKVNDKMKTVAANIAAHAALGADDIYSKWQLMAEQAQQKRDGVVGMSSAALSGNEGRGPSRPTSGAMRISSGKIGRSLSVKDMIAVLERDHHMSKSIFLYCLFDRFKVD
ncbi:hypothetical protein MKW98_022521, partial [Papaver atlanticum]